MLLSSLSLLAYHDQKLWWWGRSGFNKYQGKCDEYTIIRGRGRDGVITQHCQYCAAESNSAHTQSRTLYESPYWLCCRAGNEPYQRLKFLNHGEGRLITFASVTQYHVYLYLYFSIVQCLNSVLNVKVLVGAFNQEKALAFFAKVRLQLYYCVQPRGRTRC